ncbi:MAG: M20/M25/M40 family metallo-hydrolase [Acidobacteria bacterium]|nr:M20/M25/M40 family metallo-hydrolase [Acidobacteriota bacterium]
MKRRISATAENQIESKHFMMKRNIIAALTLAAVLFQSSLFAQAPAIRITPAERKIAETIRADQLSNWLHFVASDAMAGRDTPSQGLDVTAEFLKMKLSRWGFRPAGDNGTFFQRMDLTRESIDAAATFVRLGDKQFKLTEDFFRLGGSGSVENAGLVFGGSGWMVKAKNYDALDGVDAKGKIVVLFSNGFPSQRTITQLPQGLSQADLAGTSGVDFADPLTNARMKGAVGIILAASPQVETAWGNIRGFFSRGSLTVEKLRGDGGGQQDMLPTILASKKLSDAIFEGESAGRDSKTAFAINKTISMAATAKKELLKTQNVVAVWEGSDPKLKAEYVAIGSHYDHVGVNENAPGDDKIYNGADDDGSGTVGMLAIAEALARSKVRPRRSILFVWHAGEEKGLWGAEYFNKFPTVDIKNVVTQLNIDMIGRSRKPDDTDQRNKDLSGPNEVYLIGSEVMSSTLGAVTKGVNSNYLKLDYNYRYDAPNDPNRFFFRSDHFHYALNGIPIAFWFTGVHQDYHQPGDHADKIDYAKMEKIVRTIFMTAWKLANMNDRPKVDKELPPELTRR